MTLKNDEKFEEKLTCHFKIDIRSLMNFDPRTQKSQECTLSWAAFDQIIYIMFELKKYRGVMFNCTLDWYKI